MAGTAGLAWVSLPTAGRLSTAAGPAARHGYLVELRLSPGMDPADFVAARHADPDRLALQTGPDTYLDDAQRERADRVGHTVWSQLRPVVEAHPQTLFVLTHFSLRHSDPEILTFVRRAWEQAGTTRPGNVFLWVHPASHLPEHHQHR